MSSRHVYDGSSGRGVGDVLVREGEYRWHFLKISADDVIRLNGSWAESELEEWGNELPTATLDALHRDLDLARVELRKRGHGRSEVGSGASRGQLNLSHLSCSVRIRHSRVNIPSCQKSQSGFRDFP